MADSTPWIARESGPEDRKFSPAAERNRDVIADALLRLLPSSGTVLEIASGTGQHISHFATLRPDLTFQPSDISSDALRSITAWVAESGGGANILPPIHLDVLAQDAEAQFEDDALAAVMCINLMHISPWEASEALFRLAGKWLPRGAPLFVYGPFFQAGVETAPSNIAFDENLRGRDTRWGIRSIEKVREAASANGFDMPEVTAMPANNLSLAFRRS
ncbi:MAG: DUF938 domain-containing protein [Pseudomonadota bacterium]